MKPQRRRLRKSEWVILLAPLLVLAMWKFVPDVSRFYWRDIRHELPGLKGSIGCMMFSPDSRHLLVVGEEDTAQKVWIRNWNLKEWRVKWEGYQSGISGRISYSHDGRKIAVTTISPWFITNGVPTKPVVDYDGCASEWQTVLYDEADGTHSALLPGHISIGEPFSSKDGKTFFLQDDKSFWTWDNQATTHIWRTPPLRKFEVFSNVILSADSTLVAAMRRKIVIRKRAAAISLPVNIVVLDATNGRCLTSWAIEGNAYPEAFSLDRKFIWCRENQKKGAKITIWDWKNRRCIEKLPESKEPLGVLKSPQGIQRPNFSFFDYSSDGHFLCNPSNLLPAKNNEVELWDVTGQKVIKRFSPYERAALSPDGKILATSYGSTVKIWDVSLLTQKPR